ncbi:ABC transporter permease [Tomitella gaofuii]|uniref:ABC transporter permease n=1 Tax=Tomitella gaofuii TaxID=2760083 RepID=UPI0015FC2D9A|nr:ABC transporter permease [Tomitella gaofuii]
MISFITRRLAAGVVVLFAVSTVTFFLLYFSSANVAREILGDNATAEQVELKKKALGLDQPLMSRYWAWLKDALQGQFGASWFSGRSVTDSIMSRLPATMSVVLVTIIVVAIVSVLIGVAAAVRRGWVDRGLQVVSISGAAVPQFVVAIVIVSVFAIRLRWFPATGYERWSDGPGLWAASITLPVLALTVSGVASTAQQVRSSTIKVLEMDYIRTLRSRGLGSSEVLFRHALRGASPAGLTVLSLHFISILGGVVVIEQIFALPGIGFLALESTTRGDMPVLMGVVVYTVILVVVINLLVDLAVGWLNPKARVS